jgi:monofunctional biosynthetic peptidoglycan transglycosylase
MSEGPDKDEPPPQGAATDAAPAPEPVSTPDDDAAPQAEAAGPEPVVAEPAPERAPGPAPEPASEPKKPKKPRSWLRRLLIAAVLLTVVFPVGLTLVYRFVPPPITYLMVLRMTQGHGLTKHWRPLSRISPALAQSVIAAEDARFCTHNGFEFEAMRKALAANERSSRVRGGSTISQQTAKNVFLTPDRSYVRKALEAYFTVLIEVLWGKRRILEVYLNVAEWGPGTYGAEAAARRYFKVSAEDLTRVQASRLAAVLPSPLRYRAVAPGPYVARRSRRIGAAAATVRQDNMAACIHG